MRTNIEIDDYLMGKALEVTDLKTKKAVVEKALKLLIQVQSQEAIRKLQGKLTWEENLSKMRTDK